MSQDWGVSQCWGVSQDWGAERDANTGEGGCRLLLALRGRVGRSPQLVSRASLGPPEAALGPLICCEFWENDPSSSSVRGDMMICRVCPTRVGAM